MGGDQNFQMSGDVSTKHICSTVEFCIYRCKQSNSKVDWSVKTDLKHDLRLVIGVQLLSHNVESNRQPLRRMDSNSASSPPQACARNLLPSAFQLGQLYLYIATCWTSATTRKPYHHKPTRRCPSRSDRKARFQWRPA